MSNDNISARLDQIQAQLAKLQESYGDIARTYYNIFYNPEPMDITLSMYDSNGELVEVTVPNRAKDASDKIYQSDGTPNGTITAPLGSLCFDRINFKLYFKTMVNGSSSEGWVELLSKDNFAPNKDYLPFTNGDAVYLQHINANYIELGTLSVERGGTGVSELNGILKGVPPVLNERGEVVTPGYVAPAIPGVDYTSLTTFTGIVCFAPISFAPEGFLICDGAAYRVDYYNDLYELLRRRYVGGHIKHVRFPYNDSIYIIDGEEVDMEDPSIDVANCTDQSRSFFVVPWDETYQEANVQYFRVPNLMGYFPRFWSPDKNNTVDSEPERAVLSIQEDGVPNISGHWVQEITGIPEQYFNGAIQIAKQDDKPIQVDGKTSAPGGYYDYLISFDASRCSSVYRDELSEVIVKNVALLPIIKYAISTTTSSGE